MKLRLYIFTLLLASCLPLLAGQSELVERADSAYAADNFRDAAALYTAAIDSLGPSAGLYYNLGNSYYRMGKPGLAVLNYERALRLDPTASDARQNLAFVNSRLIDRPGERGTLIANMTDRAAQAMHSNTWAWVAFGTFLLFIGGMALYLFAPAVTWRKVGFFGGFTVLAFAVIAGFLAARGAALATATDRAVITVPSTILSTSPRTPRDRSEEAILLHEGTTMQVLDSVTTRKDSVASTWLDVQVDNEHRAWIARDAVEII